MQYFDFLFCIFSQFLIAVHFFLWVQFFNGDSVILWTIQPFLTMFTHTSSVRQFYVLADSAIILLLDVLSLDFRDFAILHSFKTRIVRQKILL